jgi:hypothetical protein
MSAGLGRGLSGGARAPALGGLDPSDKANTQRQVEASREACATSTLLD